MAHAVTVFFTSGNLSKYIHERMDMLSSELVNILKLPQNQWTEKSAPLLQKQEELTQISLNLSQKGLKEGVRPPDGTWKLPTLDESPIGLDSERMLRWWVEFAFGGKERYKFLSQNCSHIASRALIEAGARLYAKDSHTIWKPNNVKEFANKILVNLAEQISKYQKFDAILSRYAKKGSMGVMSYKDWRSVSGGASWSAHRYKELEKIDQFLQIYHKFKHQDKPGTTGNLLRVLGRIMVTAGDILAQRPQSSRKSALITLGLQVRNEMDMLRMTYFQEAYQQITRVYGMFYE